MHFQMFDDASEQSFPRKRQLVALDDGKTVSWELVVVVLLICNAKCADQIQICSGLRSCGISYIPISFSFLLPFNSLKGKKKGNQYFYCIGFLNSSNTIYLYWRKAAIYYIGIEEEQQYSILALEKATNTIYCAHYIVIDCLINSKFHIRNLFNSSLILVVSVLLYLQFGERLATCCQPFGTGCRSIMLFGTLVDTHVGDYIHGNHTRFY